MCLSSPDTCKSTFSCELFYPSSIFTTYHLQEGTGHLVAAGCPARRGVVALKHVNELSRLVLDEFKVLLPDSADLEDVDVGTGPTANLYRDFATCETDYDGVVSGAFTAQDDGCP